MWAHISNLIQSGSFISRLPINQGNRSTQVIKPSSHGRFFKRCDPLNKPQNDNSFRHFYAPLWNLLVCRRVQSSWQDLPLLRLSQRQELVRQLSDTIRASARLSTKACSGLAGVSDGWQLTAVRVSGAKLWPRARSCGAKRKLSEIRFFRIRIRNCTSKACVAFVDRWKITPMDTFRKAVLILYCSSGRWKFVRRFRLGDSDFMFVGTIM